MSTARRTAILNAALVLANLLALNVVLAPVRARLDLTERKEYTVSAATRKLLRALDDRVEIHGYFSEKTHPKLAPLVPRLRDLVDEYRVASDGKVAVDFGDPRRSDEVEKDAFRRFDVRPASFVLETKYESGVASAYFTLVVARGDRFQKLGTDELIEVVPLGQTDFAVRLRNIEYQLTRAIEKVGRESGVLEARLAERKDPARVRFFVTDPARLEAGELKDYVDKRRSAIQEVAEDLRKRYKVGLEVALEDPAEKPGRAEEVAQAYGVQQLRASALSKTPFYLDAIVEADGQGERIGVRDVGDRERSPAEIREAVEASVRRLIPGALRKIGVSGPRVDVPPEMLMEYYKRGMQPPGDEFQALRAALRKAYEVQDVDLSSGRPPLEVDVLIVLRPKDWTEKQELALDQYLMYGGKAIVCLDATEIDKQARQIGQLLPIEPKVDRLLASYGVTLRRALVQDDRNVPYPMPVKRNLGGIILQSTEQVPYPWFLDVRGASIDRQNPVIASVDLLQLFWASPLDLDLKKLEKLKVATLVTSSDKAWTSSDIRNARPPDNWKRGQKWYTVPEKVGKETLAVSVEGKLASGFKERPEAVTAPAGLEVLTEAAAPTRLAVIGDADFVADYVQQMPAFKSNVQFVESLVDWALLDDEMIGIRAKSGVDRSLKELDEPTKQAIEMANYAVPIGLVIVFGIVRAAARRRAARRVGGAGTGAGRGTGTTGGAGATS